MCGLPRAYEVNMLLSKIVERFRVTAGKEFRLEDYPPDDIGSLDTDKREAKDLLATGIERLKELQERLYAQDRWALLLIFQAMDAAGKDGAIKHVMSGLNPQGCQVHAFKAPSPQELDHDFMWRTTVALPERGRIGVFNRSYYEEVLVVRVHPEILQRQKLPPKLVTKNIWTERLEDIRNFEGYIARNGIVAVKFFLNISKDEQRKRFLERLDDPEKHWKFSARDVGERKLWDRYMEAYEEAIRATASNEAPWYVVPADRKWFARLVVAGAIVETMERLDLQFPKTDPAALKQMEQAAASLRAERPPREPAKARRKS
jgi:PPK2 family polyphosphate:nucleotide phosphotransferase